MSSVKAAKKGQETKICNLEREYKDCAEETRLAYHDAPSAIYCAVAQ